MAGAARRRLARDRSAGHGRGAAPARPARRLRREHLGEPRRRLARDAATTSIRSASACEGVSLGGYYCPRAVAFEPRFACGVVWGANHDWRDVQKKRLAQEGDFPVPHYWDHVRWVWGAKDMDDFMRIAEDVHLDGVLERISVPFLVTHGEQDKQIPAAVGAAHLRAARQQSEARAEDLHRPRRRRAARSFDNSINAGPLHRRLGGRDARRPHGLTRTTRRYS